MSSFSFLLGCLFMQTYYCRVSVIKESPLNAHSNYTVKKVHEFPISSRDVTNQTPHGQE
jgi:hypothetical protein